jgi:hypothetical protein
MQPGAVLLLHLFYGVDLSPKGGKLCKFLLDGLQPLMPLAVSDLSICFIFAVTPILLVQVLNLGNLLAKTPDLFPQDFEVIHRMRIAHSAILSQW